MWRNAKSLSGLTFLVYLPPLVVVYSKKRQKEQIEVGWCFMSKETEKEKAKKAEKLKSHAALYDVRNRIQGPPAEPRVKSTKSGNIEKKRETGQVKDNTQRNRATGKKKKKTRALSRAEKRTRHEKKELQKALKMEKRAEEEYAAYLKTVKENPILQQDNSNKGPYSQLDWELLPPGEKGAHEVRRYWEEVLDKHHKFPIRMQLDRLDEIEKLKPTTRWIGKARGMEGYIVYEFGNTENVILECPIEGNAVYVLKGDNWEETSKLPKAEIRSKGLRVHRRVIHKKNWVSRMRKALYDL